MYACTLWSNFVLTLVVVILLVSRVWSVGIYTASDNALRGRVSGYPRHHFQNHSTDTDSQSTDIFTG